MYYDSRLIQQNVSSCMLCNDAPCSQACPPEHAIKSYGKRITED